MTLTQNPTKTSEVLHWVCGTPKSLKFGDRAVNLFVFAPAWLIRNLAQGGGSFDAYDEAEIRKLASDGISKAQIARNLGVSRMTVYRALQ